MDTIAFPQFSYTSDPSSCQLRRDRRLTRATCPSFRWTWASNMIEAYLAGQHVEPQLVLVVRVPVRERPTLRSGSTQESRTPTTLVLAECAALGSCLPQATDDRSLGVDVVIRLKVLLIALPGCHVEAALLNCLLVSSQSSPLGVIGYVRGGS